MNIVQITPGAGGMYCGNCFRDNAMVRALRRMGHSTLMVPLYLPLKLDEPDESAGTPIFFGGLNVYLEQKSALFRNTPDWLHDWLSSPKVLQWAAGKAAKTRASDLGDLTLSMMRGESGNQSRELDELIAWLKTQPAPDVICLSNALLVGLARRLKAELGAPVVCFLQGEDTFLDALPDSHRDAAWKLLQERAADVALFVAPSRYFGELMRGRLNLGADRVRVVYNGISLDGFQPPKLAPQPPAVGFFARMCEEKGLHTLVEAYLLLKQREATAGLRLRVGGGCGPGDEPFVHALRERLKAASVLDDVEFFPNLDRAEKLAFYQSISIFSVPALYGEAFGLYVIEAMATGVPVVQPRVAAFPELVEATGGGVLCEPNNPKSLADAIENLLLHPLHTRGLGRRAREAVERQFTEERMADNLVAVFKQVLGTNRAN